MDVICMLRGERSCLGQLCVSWWPPLVISLHVPVPVQAHLCLFLFRTASCLPCSAQAPDRQLIFSVCCGLIISQPFQSWLFFLLLCGAFLQCVCVLAWHSEAGGLFFSYLFVWWLMRNSRKSWGNHRLYVGEYSVMVNLTFPKYSELIPLRAISLSRALNEPANCESIS